MGGVERAIAYTYDVAGNRTSVTTPSGRVFYTFDARNRMDTVIQNGVVLTDYDYDTNSNLILTSFSNGTYDAFGEVLAKKVETVSTQYLFTGEYFDGALGQTYLRDRFYDSGIGRFTRQDTYEGSLWQPLSRNSYLYGYALPTSRGSLFIVGFQS